jgi:hypothetical protein
MNKWELKRAIQTPEQFLIELLESMPQRVAAVLHAYGGRDPTPF